MMNNTWREFRRHAKRAGLVDHEKLTIHSLRKSCGVNWTNHLPIHVTKAYMGHADIKTTQQYYLTVGEEYAEQASWVIERVTSMAGATTITGGTTDAKLTPGHENDALRHVS